MDGNWRIQSDFFKNRANYTESGWIKPDSGQSRRQTGAGRIGPEQPRSGCVLLELDTVQMRVQPVLRQQLAMTAALDDAPRFHHQNPVGAFDGRQTVRDHECG